MLCLHGFHCDTVRSHLQITSVFWSCLKFSASISQSGTPLTAAATVDAGCVSDAYPRGQPTPASTFCPGTGRRTWRLPCWFWLSYLHQSVVTKGRLYLILHFSVFMQKKFLLLVLIDHLGPVGADICAEIYIRFLPSHSCCWDSGVGSLVQACVRRPFHMQCPEQTSPLASGPQQSLTTWQQTHLNRWG